MFDTKTSRLQLAVAAIIAGVLATTSAAGPWEFLGAFAVYVAVCLVAARVFNGLTRDEPGAEPDVAE